MKIKSNVLKVLFIFILPLAFSAGVANAEDWKGNTTYSNIEVGALVGGSTFGTDFGFSTLGSVAYQIAPEGWIEDIDERVWTELQMGIAFFNQGSTQTALQYSAHLRWDFTKDDSWTIYALGGLAGYFLPAIYGNSFTMRPRVGLGALFQTKLPVSFRGEVSAEFIGLGAVFHF